MWGDKLALKMTPNFEIGVTITVMLAGEGRPATLATWLHTWSSHGNAQPVDPGKRFNGFNFSYRLPGLRNWLTIYADGMANDEPNPIAYPRAVRLESWSILSPVSQAATILTCGLRGFTPISLIIPE